MSDFTAFSEEIDAGMEFLEHHQILGAKWGVMNGPPYPLGKGDHSSSEKKAAKAAGVSVGSDSGKGSIDKVKKPRSKSPSKPKTPEERRAEALEAVKKGDKKKITKNMDQLSTDELRDAEARAKLKDSLTNDKDSKAYKDKIDAIQSGDKEKVKQYADKMSYNELVEAMNKVDLMQRLNYEPPPPTVMDRVAQVANAAGKFKDAAEKGIGAYNQVAKIMNVVNKEANWPIIGEKPSQEQQAAKQVAKDVSKQVQDTRQQQIQQQQQKSHKELADEALRNAKIDYKNEQKFEKWKEKQEAKANKKSKDEVPEETPKKNEDHEYIKKEGEGEDAKYIYKEDMQNKSEKEAKMEQHESNKNSGIHRFNSSTKDRLDQATKAASGNDFAVPVAFTSENYSKGPKAKNVNWNTGINAENMSNWKSTWNSVEEASKNSKPISDDLTPAEREFLESFRKG